MVLDAFNGPFWHKPVFYVALAFVLFVLLFGRRLWAALTAMLDQRIAAVQRELTEAAQLRREAERMLADAKTRRERALADAKTLIEHAQAEASRIGADARSDAQAAGRRREQMAMDRIAAAEQAALRDVRMTAAEIAAAAAERVIAESLTADADAALIDRAIAGLPGALAAQRAA